MRDIGYYTILCRSFLDKFLDSMIFWRYTGIMEHFLLVGIMKYLWSTLYIVHYFIAQRYVIFKILIYYRLLYPRLCSIYICCLCSSINFFMTNFIFILCEVITKVNKTSKTFTLVLAVRSLSSTQ